jgi:hypothetical protein
VPHVVGPVGDEQQPPPGIRAESLQLGGERLDTDRRGGVERRIPGWLRQGLQLPERRVARDERHAADPFLDLPALERRDRDPHGVGQVEQERAQRGARHVEAGSRHAAAEVDEDEHPERKARPGRHGGHRGRIAVRAQRHEPRSGITREIGRRVAGSVRRPQRNVDAQARRVALRHAPHETRDEL